MSLSFDSFSSEHVPAASELVAARYRGLLRVRPEVAAAFAEPAAVRERIDAMAAQYPGVAAMETGRLVGFLIGYLGTFRREHTAYVPEFGHGVATEDGVDLYRRLYAEIGESWRAAGSFAHSITLFATEENAERTWVSLGFGRVVDDAIRSLEAEDRVPADMEIRRATVDDIAAIMPLESALNRHLAAAPIFIPWMGDEAQERRRTWLEDNAHGLWLALHESTPVGYLCMEPGRETVLPIAMPNMISITGAYTVPAARGCGVGGALLRHGFAWARAQGYRRCAVDFETANLPGSAFWYGSGFLPVCHSLARRLDPRLEWAHAGRR